MKIRYLLLFFSLLYTNISSAQNQDNVWAFGYHNGLDFNSGSSVFWESNIDSWYPTASISDENGQLLFYTDGNTIQTADGHIMLNGNLFSDHSLVLKIVILKSVAKAHQYYIFQNRNQILSYSVLDLSLNKEKGEVIRKNIHLSDDILDIAPIKGNNCFTYWLLTKKSIDSTFIAFKINENGINVPIYSFGLNSIVNSTVGLSPNLYKLIVSPDGTMVVSLRYGAGSFMPGSGSNSHHAVGFEISLFDAANGMVKDPIFIPTPYKQNHVADDISSMAFSQNGKMLYVNRALSPNGNSTAIKEIYQYNLSFFPDINAIQNSRDTISTSSNVTSMRLAPDGKIYLTSGSLQKWSNETSANYFFTNYISCIHNPNASGASCNFEEQYLLYPSFSQFPVDPDPDGFPRSGFYGYSLPGPTIPQPFKTTNTPIVSEFLCPSQSKTISVAGDYDRYKWYDGSTKAAHTFNHVGVFWVYKFKDCHLTIDSFELLNPEVHILEKDTFACRLGTSEITLHAKANIPGSFSWNNGDVGSSTTIQESGQYIVSYATECGILKDTVNVTFIEDCDCKPFIPNAFSPNGDGINDVFKIQAICPISHYFLSIYNRYGQQVFGSARFGEGWDGRFKGKPLPSGTYYYHLSYESLGYLKFQLKGDVVLLR